MASENLIEITELNFDEQALKSDIPVLVDFTAAWCAPCRMIAPHIDAIADAYAGRLRVGKCDVDANPELTAKLDVRSMPTLMVFKNGQVVGQLIGAAPRARLEDLVTRALG
ncbi:MAG: thioredoxin 1 [Myxococcales bacterium]|jgi:thioredoxin 1|nr:thioredoxin 1 [Myxococcales bacterium]